MNAEQLFYLGRLVNLPIRCGRWRALVVGMGCKGIAGDFNTIAIFQNNRILTGNAFFYLTRIGQDKDRIKCGLSGRAIHRADDQESVGLVAQARLLCRRSRNR